MKYIYVLSSLFLVISFSSCTNYNNIIDSGTANGVFDGSIYEYMASDSVVPLDSEGMFIRPMSNWGLTLQMIHRGGLDDLFKGGVDSVSSMTFMGPTSYSVMNYLFANYGTSKAVSVSMIDSATCREIILRYVFQGKFMRSDIPSGTTPPDDGGKDFISLGGSNIWLYTFTEPYYPNVDGGPVILGGKMKGTQTLFQVASADIVSDNGVVHSLPSSFSLTSK